MITLKIERSYGSATVRARVTAPSMERALQLCGKDSYAVEPERSFALPDAAESAELHSTGVAGRVTRAAA
jgi:hypothetical protein